MRSVKLFILLLAFPLLGMTCVSREKDPEPPPPGGMYRSDDGGKTWEQRVVFEDGRHIASVVPTQVTLDRNNPDTIYIAAGASGLLRTVDGGEVWSRIESDAALVSSIALHPSDSATIFIAGIPEGSVRGKIWKSSDYGDSWREVYSEPVGEQERVIGGPRIEPGTVAALEISPLLPDHVFTASSTGAVTVSLDGGETWTQRHEFSQPVTGLRLSRDDSHVLYVRLQDGSLMRSGDAAETFEDISVDIDMFRKAAMFSMLELPLYERNILMLFVGTDRGLYRSEDIGSSWDRVPLPVTEDPPVRVTALAESVNGVLWAGSGNNLYSSRDGGVTWSVYQFEFSNRIRFIETSPAKPDVLYIFFLPS